MTKAGLHGWSGGVCHPLWAMSLLAALLPTEGGRVPRLPGRLGHSSIPLFLRTLFQEQYSSGDRQCQRLKRQAQRKAGLFAREGSGVDDSVLALGEH